ncbi:FAD-binding oxidoreductase [Streptomyces sp. KPB2]|uniref:FAD-binding and (Fe-S)-binding domain-containing protein n=1 Tax=unclassified Streptomyces TaxID=2593676 RepID=UPI000F70BFEB|nr:MULTISPECIES: FAD-binding and (Fe-S)-binding domain-containing protein [unclassified Streptomyces]AZM74980.1 FAD-binding oxidoreductase [Streptomyces sp. KPB2]MDU0256847.1 FAD-binding and (Fe-S)-binding domain-containing protein [Streptomyces sp. PU10]QKW60494.1 FAD-binding oxidoreductase [Streptomyces sp. NA03103]
MGALDLPEPVTRDGAPPPVDTDGLRAALRERVDGEIRFDAGSRAAYSTDASNFRQTPIGVVVPRTPEAGAEAVAVAREFGAPVLSRGGGTSLAGQCTNAGVVLDWSKYCTRVESVDPDARTCVVQPGIVLDDLNRQLAPYGLRYGPEPATHPNCTIGGMIGNNSCGATAQAHGKVVDNIARLEVLLYDGTRFWCGETDDEEYAEIERQGDLRATVYRRLRALRDTYGDEVRRRFPDIPRRVSGYNLDSLLPEYGFDVAGLLVGSESTLVTVLRAELELVPVVKERSLLVLGFDSIDKAADAVPEILPHEPIALEGVDARLVRDERIKHLNEKALAEMPEGNAYLMVQFGGDTVEEADARAHRMLEAVHRSEHDADCAFLDDPGHEQDLWQVREAGLGATAHIPGRPDTFEGWEDSAVSPDRLGDYLRRLRALFEEFGYLSDTGPSLYGHFGQGCVHTRIPFDLYTADGVATYRRFMERAADLVVEFGGSLSGEHGDGQSRGELLSRMFGDRLVEAFGRLKAVFDPLDRMNPGKIVAPYGLDENLRLGSGWAPFEPRDLHFGFPHDGGSFSQAANRCVGVGKCRQHTSDGTVMCPSYQVTREEEHSTRGRARLLFEMLDGHGDAAIRDGWRSEAVKDALDLCLACKGCKKDCPADVDMATYKAEFLSHHYAGRPWRRPRSDWSMGWLPALAQVVGRTRLGPVVNALTHAPLLSKAAVLVAGVADREVPLFAERTFEQWFADHEPEGDGHRGSVLLWPDTFTNHFHPHIGRAAVRVLEHAGWRVRLPDEALCCGLTWISTGQLGTAEKVLTRTVRALAGHVRSGGLVVALEPSCTAVFRADAAELFPGDQDVRRLAEQTVTLSELLTEHSPGYEPPRVPERSARALAQVHCHQHAVLGWEADRELLRRAGVDAERLDSGCCGLAGNFGFERGHLDVSEACAERVLLPRLREEDESTVVLADGFSCRTQIHEFDSGGHEGVHLAELLASALPGGPATHPEVPGSAYGTAPGARPGVPSRRARVLALAGTAAAAVGTAGAAAVLARSLRRH